MSVDEQPDHKLQLYSLRVINLPLCAFSELVPAYDSSTFVLVSFR